ncbi:MAG: WG repeat-containing protein [Bacteroidota bacterium]
MKTTLKLLIIGLIILFNSCTSSLFTKKRPVELYLFTENDKWGYMDKNGKVKIKPIYDGCCFSINYSEQVCTQNFTNSSPYCVIKKGDKFGMINAKGNEIIPFQYDDIGYNSSDSLFKVKSNDKWGVIDTHNNLIFPFVFNDKYDLKLYNEFGYGKIKDVVYKLDCKTKEMTPTKYSGVIWCDEDLSEVKVDGKYGFMNKKGELVIQPIYQNASQFEEGLAAVQLDGKWGFIDTLGNMVIKPQFDDVRPFRGGNTKYAVFQIDEKYGAIDRKGNFVIKPVYDGIYDVSDTDSPEVLLAACLKNDKGQYRWGLINQKEEWLLANEYQYLYCDNHNVTAKNGGGLYGVFKLKSKKIIIPFEYESIDYYHDDGLTLFQKKDSASGKSYFGYFDINGKVIWRQKTEE